ncbi:MAG: glycosyltransferase family 4 protein [Planctomycetales bacterium]|nr:glycosyltransferase family 4 protein [Planctomycetales bacterium]
MPSTPFEPTQTNLPLLPCRVVALTHYLPPYMASALAELTTLVRELQILLSIDQEPNRKFERRWSGLTVQVQNNLMLRRLWRHRTGFADELYVHIPYDTYNRLRHTNPDIVFSYELGFRSLLSALYCRRYRKPLALCVCVSEHTERGRGALRHMLRRILLRQADAVTYNGPSCLRYLQRFAVPQEKLFPFPYAASEEFQFEGPVARPQHAEKRLLYIGQLTERKGLQPMLQALTDYCRQTPERLLELDVIGCGKLAEKLQAIPLPGNFRLQWLGHLGYDAIRQAMARAGILVFPTLADEWGMVVNEALAAGMPVLGSQYAQACTTLLQEGQNGWLYYPDRPGQLQAKLNALFALTPAELSAMRLAAQASVADITPRQAALQAAKMFEYLLAQPSLPT